ncbi:hypothetical protein [Rappaport israeli]|uniref:hypothetical protein n=1 Tax=Rappaport israeli TaxID=1839807 RepID=UPI000A49664E|nr:hypothetical protein [Rappaport israeli]
MNAEIGHLALNLTGGIAFLQFLLPVLTPYPENIAPLVKRLALAQALLLTLSLCALGYAFYTTISACTMLPVTATAYCRGTTDLAPFGADMKAHYYYGFTS